ncbi:putative nuclease of putative toxin-antitoxin system [Flavobacterium arsenatis]|uniref:Nuclease of putative toxin-antitoxin system n=1 Tax=Flavobacterium arsenatis TaxID=1484332 RepID=A0ABU1TMS2_9FLAO|nr:DUF5615 family PIN-like protein [Flavobacterium arsenatis]MDR6967235.1 putative nuclease of putative toxin-antitoxin system [Flavobacterium arsenatis]
MFISSYKLSKRIENLGFECIHVNFILEKWFTTDTEIAKFADENNYILISKDADFKNSFLVNKTPKKLIKINLGNISNTELILIFEKNIGLFEELAKNDSFILEIDKDKIIYQFF